MSSKTRWTPGPWSIGPYGKVQAPGMDRWDCIGVSGLALTSGAQAEANTRLIAAAPDLYDALSDMLAAYDVPRECCNKARAALAKARGEQRAKDQAEEPSS